MNWVTILAPIAGICAVLFAYFLIIRIKRMDPGTAKMKEIAANIHSGAMAFLKRQYRTLIIFIIVIIAVIAIVGLVSQGSDSLKPETAIAFAIVFSS